MVFPYDIPWVTPNALTDDECDYIRELAIPNLEWSAQENKISILN